MRRSPGKVRRVVAGGVVLAVALATLVLIASSEWLASFGALPSGARLERVRRSPNFRDGKFRNLVETHTMVPGSLWRTLRLQFTGDEERVPTTPIPIVTLQGADVATPPASGLRTTWLGHSTTLLEIDGQRVLLDPVWSERVSPSSLVGPKRFHPPPLALEALPPLDVVIFSHDHYDHLDMSTVRALATSAAQRGARFVTGLGVGAHLERWGVPIARITELDWGESVTVGSLTVTATPGRHFTGRGLLRGDRALWATWVIAGPAHRAFFSGDTGFFEGFADIGRDHGPFDLTLIKIGAYGPTWPDIHLTPETAVRAHTLLRGRLLQPIHWSTFNLAYHAWYEPADRVLAAAREAGVDIVVPRPGEQVEPSAPPPVATWWRADRR